MTSKNTLRHYLFYAIFMFVSVTLLIAVLKIGQIDSVIQVSQIHAETPWVQIVQTEMSKNMSSPLASLIIQLLVILVFSRICAFTLSFLGQPQVVGEMIAGFLMGQSVLGYFWPAGFEALFPESSMPRLFFLSQIGLIFFMFVVGLNLKASELKNRGSAAVMISHSSIVLPFILGSLLAMGLYKPYGPRNFDFVSFALFIGIAMSITAFPILARILHERRLTETPLGALALTCAAVDDITAWCVLASVIGIVRAGSAMSAVVVILAALIYVGFMIKFMKPFLEKVLCSVEETGSFTRGQLAFIFCLLLSSSMITQTIGIHAVFGAFLLGVIMPQSQTLRSQLVAKIEDVTVVVLLPLFFVYTGIRTQIGLINSGQARVVCLAVIAVAVIGKMVGSALAARWSGISWRESWALGTLMNARGLMELIVLNIGYDLGILSPTLFTMFVIMAIVTTVMTGPLLSWILPKSSPTLAKMNLAIATPVYIDKISSAAMPDMKEKVKPRESEYNF